MGSERDDLALVPPAAVQQHDERRVRIARSVGDDDGLGEVWVAMESS